MKYKVKTTRNFEKCIRRCIKRGLDENLLWNVVNMLANGQQLEPKYKDHKLHGKYKEYRECHIENDWLLIYKIEDDKLILTLTDTGTHSDLF